MGLPIPQSFISSNHWDVVVIGAGAAGLMACLEMPKDLKILLLNRNTSRRSASRWAQGGIAAVIRPEDSLDSHAEDTLKAGAGLCDLNAVKMFVTEAPNCVRRLESLGMEFDRFDNKLSTTLEAAHSHRRVLHVKDRTGRALVDVLEDQVEQSQNIFHHRGVRVTQLLVENKSCYGVQVLDGPYLYYVSSRAVVMASGGGGHLFVNTTNPSQACGEGIALAWKAGAVIEDLEFVQFHPTALKLKGAPCFLLSEALRGEGAVLLDQYGDSPVSDLHGSDLAPRDQVSRTLVEVMQKQKVDYMGLDLTTIPLDLLESRFPTILGQCRELGLEPLRELIPIAPAAHYWMGGVATNLQSATSIKALYAVGEVACTGLHGANRLASNSLMECLVFAKQMGCIQLQEKFRFTKKEFQSSQINFSIPINGFDSSDSIVDAIKELRILCWKEAGVTRSIKGMKKALISIQTDFARVSEEPLLKLIENQKEEEILHFDNPSRKNLNLLLDLNHRQLTTSLLLEACLFRTESRGGHFRTDAPTSLPYWRSHSRQRKGHNLSTRDVSL